MKNVVNLTIDISSQGNLSLSLGDFCDEDTSTFLYRNPIKKYIDLFNKSKFSVINNKLFGKSYEVYLSYYSNKYLFGNQHGIANDSKCYSFNGHEDCKESLSMYDRPTIHLTYGDILRDNIEPYKRYARYMDSSIWNYYVPVLIADKTAIIKGEDGKMRPLSGRYNFTPLMRVLGEILNNYLYNLYQLRVAREYAHLFGRIVNQSFLPDNSGHGKNVSPFLFHSERKSLEDLEEKEHIDILTTIKQFKWRFLLVDDHSKDKLAAEDGTKGTLMKLDIVKEEIKRLYETATKKDDKNENIIIATENDNKDIKKKANIYIECATSIDDAKNKLKEKKFEIILLDYLLGEKDGGREYGYELLDWISKQEKEANGDDAKFEYKKGPDNRFYFMFISAFTTAVSERLLTEGWLRSEKYWYIGEGACPINTPYLFQYRLLHIMQKRMKDMGLAKWNVKEQEKEVDSADNKTDQPSNAKDIYNELINEIYTGEGVRKRANDKFQDILDLLYHYKNLLLDTDMPSDNVFDSAESVLATNFVMNHMGYEGVLEHLTQLVYLTAFGTVRQWPEMWEEYQYIKSYLGRIQCVEDFIVNLKNNSIK